MIPTSLLIYLVKVALAQGFFFALYFALFRRLKFFQGNRLYLLYSMLIAFALPLLSFQADLPQAVVQVESIQEPITTIRAEIAQWETSISPPVLSQEIAAPPPNLPATDQYQAVTSPVGIWAIIGSIYGIGFLLSLVLLSIRLLRLGRVYRNSFQGQVNGKKVWIQDQLPTSSFFKIVFWNQGEVDSENELSILQHELVHGKQWHSLDNLLTQLNAAVLWFSPVSYWLSKQLHLQHEFIADDLVSRSSEVTYQNILAAYLEKFGSVRSNLPAVPFASMLRERMDCLERPTQRIGHAFKYVLLLPVLLGLVLVLSQQDFALTPLINKSEQSLDYHPRLKLGDLVFEFHLRETAEGDQFVSYAFLDFDAVDRIWQERIQAYPSTSPVVSLSEVSVIDWSNHRGSPQITTIAPGGIGRSLSELVPSLTHLDENQSVEIRGAFDDVPFSLQMDRSPMKEGRQAVLEHDEVRYLMTTLGRVDAYQVSPEILESILLGFRYHPETGAKSVVPSTYLHIAGVRQPVEVHNTAIISVIDTDIRELSLPHAIRLLKEWDVIESPILISLPGKDGRIYRVAFASSATPTIHYGDLGERLKSHPLLRMEVAEYNTQPIDLKWGDVTILAAGPMVFNSAYLWNRVLVGGQIVRSNEIPLRVARDMMASSPRDLLSGERVGFTLGLTDRDHLPMDCAIDPDARDELPCLEEIRDKLGVGDFINVGEIKDSDGHLLMAPFLLKVVAEEQGLEKMSDPSL